MILDTVCTGHVDCNKFNWFLHVHSFVYVSRCRCLVHFTFESLVHTNRTKLKESERETRTNCNSKWCTCEPHLMPLIQIIYINKTIWLLYLRLYVSSKLFQGFHGITHLCFGAKKTHTQVNSRSQPILQTYEYIVVVFFVLHRVRLSAL